MMKCCVVLLAVAVVVFSSPVMVERDLKCCHQHPHTLECYGEDCNDFCCGCSGECVKDSNLGCDWIECAIKIAQCIQPCCEGSCIGSSACIGCLGSSYETCKDCWSLTERERYTNLIMRGINKSNKQQ